MWSHHNGEMLLYLTYGPEFLANVQTKVGFYQKSTLMCYDNGTFVALWYGLKKYSFVTCVVSFEFTQS